MTCVSNARPLLPSNWFTVGCSYQYNSGILTYLENGKADQGGMLKPRAGYLASQRESWVHDPARYILIHEPSTRLYGCSRTGARWYQWHYSKQYAEFTDPQTAPQRFISPILFVDGHAAVHDFSKSLSTDPYFPYEPTQYWVWYKPAEAITP